MATAWNQNTPLHLAARKSNAAVVAALIKAGAEVNRGDSINMTPLYFACARSDSDAKPVLILLIRNGADINANDRYGDTPLEWAIHYSSYRFFPILLRAGAALPARRTNAYIRKVIAADGIQRYERAHLNALAASFAPKFSPLLPPELVRRVVEYAFHVGDY